MPKPTLTPEQLIGLLKDEYLQVQKSIEDFDTRALNIKTWSVTFSLAAIGGGFVSKEPLAFLVASFSALVFWVLEAHWKAFQDAHYGRGRTIEAYFRGEGDEPVPFQIATSFLDRFHKTSKAKMIQIALWPHVMLPHVLVVFVGAGLYCLRTGLLK